jgi:hypothetical protein
MDAKDLMIGNYIYKKVKNNYYLTEVSHEDLYSISCGNRKHYQYIDITKDLLLGLGFLKDDDGVFYLKDFRIDVYWLSDGWEVAFDHVYIKTIKYIHEIQQMFFVLENFIIKKNN